MKAALSALDETLEGTGLEVVKKSRKQFSINLRQLELAMFIPSQGVELKEKKKSQRGLRKQNNKLNVSEFRCNFPSQDLVDRGNHSNAGEYLLTSFA